MIQDRVQYLLSKDDQQHKWRLQKQWMSYQDYQDAQDKQQTQYQLTPRSKWKMHHHCSKFRSQNVQMFGYVYQNTNGPVWKIRSFFLSEMWTVILWQDHCGTGNSREFFFKIRLEKVPSWECFFVYREKGLFLSVYVDDLKTEERNKILTQCGKYSWKTLIWENRHHSLTMFFWIVLTENVK